jgi:hypothetical protein
MASLLSGIMESNPRLLYTHRTIKLGDESRRYHMFEELAAPLRDLNEQIQETWRHL